MSKATTSRMERAVHPGRLHVRSSSKAGGDQVGFVGYASTVGTAYSVRDFLGEYDETILPGAFSKTLREQAAPDGPGVPLLIDHEPSAILANTKSGTSRLTEDKGGLRNEADLDRRSPRANEIIVSLERGDLSSMSFSFAAVREIWNKDFTDRRVGELRLFDTSIVTYPANPATSAALRSAAQARIGREGVWRLGEMRRDLPALVARREVAGQEDLLDGALRVFQDADRAILDGFGAQCRGRGLLVVESLAQIRSGKVLSKGNQSLLASALDALSMADTHHQSATSAIHTVLDSATEKVPGTGGKTKKAKGGGVANGKSGDGKANGTPPGNGNPINPSDGAGPRSAVLRGRRREQEVEAFKRGGPIDTAQVPRVAVGRRREQEIAEFSKQPGAGARKIEWSPKEFERQLKKVKAEAEVRHGAASLDALELLRAERQRDGFSG